MDHSSILLACSKYPAVLAALAPRIRFSLLSTQRIPRWGDPIGGGLRIVSGEHVRIVSGEHREIIGGRCVRKWRFSKKELAFAGVQIFQELSFHILNEK